MDEGCRAAWRSNLIRHLVVVQVYGIVNKMTGGCRAAGTFNGHLFDALQVHGTVGSCDVRSHGCLCCAGAWCSEQDDDGRGAARQRGPSMGICSMHCRCMEQWAAATSDLTGVCAAQVHGIVSKMMMDKGLQGSWDLQLASVRCTAGAWNSGQLRRPISRVSVLRRCMV